MKGIRELKNIKDKIILLRVDFNVPIKLKEKIEKKDTDKKEEKDYQILDDFRIKKAIPTVKYLVKKGAKIILITHLGKDGSLGLEPVEKRFFKLSHLPKNKVSFLKNIRSFQGEEKNDLSFAKELAKKGDIFVNDAFSVSHRAHASVVGIPKYLPSYAGFQFENEIKNLSSVFKNPKHPFLFILGGAKFSTKIPLIKKYIKLADNVFIGGAIANDFLKAKGYEIGESFFDKENFRSEISEIKGYLKNKKLVLPMDVIVSFSSDNESKKESKTKDKTNIKTKKLAKQKLQNKAIGEIQKNETILDIGEETTKMLVDIVKKSKTVVWNGPLGKYEEGGDVSSLKVLKALAKSKAKSILGGGDTVALVSKIGNEKKFTLVSTGGGATLEFLAKGTLVGIEALEKKSK